MKNYNYLSSELCKLGLKRKESDVYLILLELGYCSVQKIAQKIELSRPTVYRILKSLETKKLINTTQKGKRNYFIAGSPDALLNMLRIRKRQAEEQEREFLRIINTLQDQYSFSSDENTIETYSDNKRQLAIEKLESTQCAKIKLIATKNNPALEKAILKINKRIGASLRVKILHFEKTKPLKEKFAQNKLFSNKISSKEGGIVIADRVFIFEDNKISIIKKKNVIESFELMFDIIWKKA